ncbi:MAG: hypothetical protein QXQ33_00595 [Nitrososphaerota archaeon]
MPRQATLLAYLKTLLYWGGGLILLIVGLGLTGIGQGTTCPPSCPPIPPNPPLMYTGVIMTLSGVSIFLFYGIYWFAFKWRRYFFLNIVFRTPSGIEYAEDIALDLNDEEAEIELTPRQLAELDKIMSQEEPLEIYGRRLSYWLLHNSLNDNYYVLGAIDRPSKIVHEEYRAIPIEGKFAWVRVGYAEADVYGYGSRYTLEEYVTRFGMKRVLDSTEYKVPIAVIYGSIKNTELRTLVQAEMAAFGSLTEATQIFDTISKAAQFKIVDLNKQAEERYRRILEGFASLLTKGMQYELITKGVPIYEKERETKPPITIRGILKIIIIGTLVLIVGIGVYKLLNIILLT